MTTRVGADRLEDEHDVMLLLRLLVDAQGQVVHGELGGIDEKPWDHFVGIANLPRAVQTWG
jgi:hypothetical protein